MFVLIVWGVAVGVAAVVLAIVGYSLVGQLRRFERAVAQAEADLTPRLAALRPQQPAGRHRAP